MASPDYQHILPLSKSNYYFPIGVFIESLLHGIYTVLFMTALWIWKSRRLNSKSHTVATLISAILVTLMWILSCVHVGISIQRLLRIYILELGLESFPPYKLVRDVSRWDNQVHMSLIGVIVGLGDLLVTYRTYVVWERNLWVVLFPILIDAVNTVLTTMAIYGLAHPDRIPPGLAGASYAANFPLAFLQNLLTTGLLWYKIWSQHRESASLGGSLGGRTISLGYLAQILVETAIIYPIVLLTVIILDLVRHPAVSMFVCFIPPSIGIVFVLLNVRVHFANRSRDIERDNVTEHFPNWIIKSSLDANPQPAQPTTTPTPPANLP